MRTIWKFVLAFDPDDVHLHAPIVRFVGIDPASGEIAVWIEHVADGAVDTYLRFIVKGTGIRLDDVPASAQYIGSVIQWQTYVWHVYCTMQAI